MEICSPMSDFNSPDRPTLEDPNQIPTPPAEPESKRKLLTPFLELIQTLALAAILYFAVDAVLARVIVENISMEPTLYPGNFVLVNRMAYKWGGQTHVGDIVIFHNPNDLSVDYIKRIVGTPGDTVRISNGEVVVNGIALNEPYVAAPPNYSGEWTVPPDSIFVLGDNRNNSEDSHVWGFVPMTDVIGKALVVYWPMDRFRVISHPNMLAAQ